MKSISMYSTQYLVGAPFAKIIAAMWLAITTNYCNNLLSIHEKNVYNNIIQEYIIKLK